MKNENVKPVQPPQRKSLKPSDAQYLAMINRPGRRPRGVRRCILEPSSNRLAEQCDVAHLAQTAVHSPRRASLPDLISHSFNIHWAHTHTHNMHTEINSSSSCCTKLFISDVHNDYDMNSKHIFIFHDVKNIYSFIQSP